MVELRLDGLSDAGVLEGVEVLVRRSNETTAELLAYLAEVDTRRLHVGEACGSLFAYCVERLHMSEATAWKRITAARTARRFPLVLHMIARGELHLCGVALLAPHLTEGNHAALLARARHMSKRGIEKLVAEIAPRADAPSRVEALPCRVLEVTTQGARDAHDVQAPGRVASAPPPGAACAPEVAPLSPRRYRIRVTVDEDTHAALCQLQDLLSHQIPDRDPAAIISRALAHELERTLARKTGATERPRVSKPPAKRTRHIPAAVRRKVWRRDGARCAYVDRAGRRCSSTRFLQYHHVRNWARGAEHDPAEIELRCRAHNLYQAVLDYGADFMQKKRGAPSRAGEPRAVYGSAGGRPAGRRQVGHPAGRRQVGHQTGPPASRRFGAHPAAVVVGHWWRRATDAVGADAGVASTFAVVERHACGAELPQLMSRSGTGAHAEARTCSMLATDRGRRGVRQAAAPWHFLYFWPLPQGQGSLRPTLGWSRTTGRGLTMSPST